MTDANYNWVGQALLILRDGLRPFVERRYEAVYGEGWEIEAQRVLDGRPSGDRDSVNLDVAALFTLIQQRWTDVFSPPLQKPDRDLIYLLMDMRKRWAHQEEFSRDDAFWVALTANRLLNRVSPPWTLQMQALRAEMIRISFQESEAASVRSTASELPASVLELESKLFALENEASPTTANVENLRKELAIRLNGTPVTFSDRDDWFRLGTEKSIYLYRPIILEDGNASLRFWAPTMSLIRRTDGGPIENEIVGRVRDEGNPFGMLYPRWQFPDDAGIFDENGCLGAPFVMLEHPRPDAWIATTVPVMGDQPRGRFRRSRETFVYDEATQRWNRQLKHLMIEPEELLLRQYGDNVSATTQELNASLHEWLEYWEDTIGETL